jgi:hypothetical protein
VPQPLFYRQVSPGGRFGSRGRPCVADRPPGLPALRGNAGGGGPAWGYYLFLLLKKEEKWTVCNETLPPLGASRDIALCRLVTSCGWASLAVELRECQACVHVGCCDSSVGKHATKHFHETGHPVMRSVMPGATWTWCYVHEAEGRLGPVALGS